jgi:pyruvate dehydrogenase E2 component (dihydrolipoamide acetyltransferase)
MLEPQKIRLSLADFVAKAVATALVHHPELNATFNGAEITRYGDVNLGMAVAVADGLIVPVLRGIQKLGLKEIRKRSADLAERARAGRLKQEEMTGGTFTISSLGPWGVRDFSAIINPPEVAILAVGVAEKRAVVRHDQIVARTMMNLTLSSDHRVVDGAVAAEFLRTLKTFLEEPSVMFFLNEPG